MKQGSQSHYTGTCRNPPSTFVSVAAYRFSQLTSHRVQRPSRQKERSKGHVISSFRFLRMVKRSLGIIRNPWRQPGRRHDSEEERSGIPPGGLPCVRSAFVRSSSAAAGLARPRNQRSRGSPPPASRKAWSIRSDGGPISRSCRCGTSA